MSALGYRVSPRKKKDLRTMAESWWSGLRITGDRFPIVEIVDVALSKHFGDRYTFAILEKHQMGDSHGLTDPDQLTMLIRRDVYEGACQGRGRDRFTLAHELGHLILHSGHRYLERIDPSAAPALPTHKKYEDSEWQADTFAAELLMPLHVVKKCTTPDQLSSLAAVSNQAADVRFRSLRQDGVL